MRHALAGSLALLAALTACGGGEPSVALPTVRDSAGIRIVENTTAQWREGAGWTVVDSPSVSIGGSAGEVAEAIRNTNPEDEPELLRRLTQLAADIEGVCVMRSR